MTGTTITTRKIIPLVREHFAFAKGKKVALLGQGFNSIVLQIGNTALKLLQTHPGYEPPSVLLKRELKGFRVLASLSRLPVPIPKVLGYGHFNRTDDLFRCHISCWSLTSKLAGRCFKFPDYPRYPQAIDDLGKFLSFIHSQKLRSARQTEPHPLKSTREILENVKNKEDEKLGLQLRRQIENAQWDMTLVHGDINAGNILLKGKRLSGILDLAELNYDAREWEWCHAMLHPKFARLLIEAYYRHGGKKLNLESLYLMSAINHFWNILADENLGKFAQGRKGRKKLPWLLRQLTKNKPLGIL